MLGMVSVFSLIVAFTLSYFVITYLSNEQGYRLSLAGVAGLIVAIGITADSFIVFFERIRDELRDGKTLESSIAGAWRRAFRTILASDTVGFLAAAVLFILAVGNVRGFAFTLGITTIVDLIIVALFTQPLMQLLGRTQFFSSGNKLSGLDPRALGAVYRGRAQFREPVAAGPTAAKKSAREAKRRQTIAERKAEQDAMAEGKK
jgi:preprotein translocase subunit SecD